jgi:phosphatidylglycerophosphate synthase
LTAHALTALRLLLAAPFAWCMARGGAGFAWLAAVAIVCAIATDLADGAVARRLGTASAAGRAFDHASDFLFVTGGLLGGALRGAFPLLLPILVAVAFTQYVVDSYVLRRQRQLVMSSLGRWNGVLYFVPVCGDVLVRTGLLELAGLGVLAPLVGWIAWALVLSTVASIGDRLLALSRTAPDSPAGGTAGRSRH